MRITIVLLLGIVLSGCFGATPSGQLYACNCSEISKTIVTIDPDTGLESTMYQYQVSESFAICRMPVPNEGRRDNHAVDAECWALCIDMLGDTAKGGYEPVFDGEEVIACDVDE